MTTFHVLITTRSAQSLAFPSDSERQDGPPNPASLTRSESRAGLFLRLLLGRIAVALMIASGIAPAATGAEFAEVVPVASLDTVLVRFVHTGHVDYGGLARDPRPLRRYLALTESAEPERFDRNAQLAFWINVYNARVLDGVIRRPGLRSVLDVGRIFLVPTMRFFNERLRSARRDLTLNDIEQRIIREEFHDPRVHFVLNCASRSCPALPERALTGAGIDSTLNEAARAFQADPAKNDLRPGEAPALSAIFRWYASDFAAAEGGVTSYIERHAPSGARFIPGQPVRYLKYDWSLNGDW